MTVNITSPAAGVTRTLLDQSTTLSAALKASAPQSSGLTQNSSTNVASSAVDTSALTQSPTVSFRVDALNIAFVGSKVDVVDSGATHVSRLLGQLQSIAARATAGLSQSALDQLDGQFQALRLAINNVPPGPPGVTFTADELAEGLQQSVDAKATIGGFTGEALLPDTNVKTPEAAQAALATIATAQQTVDAQRVIISQLQNDIDFASASVDGALQNQDALRSTLSAGDLNAGTGTSLAANLSADPQAAVAAQTARLPNDILRLLQQ